MTRQGEYQYEFTERLDQSPSNGWRQLFSDELNLVKERNNELKGRGATPPVWAQDLLQLSRVVYLADRLALRKHAPDRWTRTIRLRLKLIDDAPWRPHLPLLETLLATLTADRWEISVSGGLMPRDDTVMFPGGRVSEVALFSGGLDSFCYAAQRVQVDGEPLMLVTLYTGDRPLQQRLRKRLDALSQREVIAGEVPYQNLVPYRPRPPSCRRRKPLEPSTRSRGLLFIAHGVYAAAANRVGQLAVPENGQLALNPPLAPDRVAACSTRSVHPRTLELVNQLIRGVGGDVEVVNPLLGYTKAEVCAQATAAGVDAAALAATISCGQPFQNRRGGPEHCGYCFPCLVRRAALWQVLGADDRTRYLHDPWNEDSESVGQHLLALLTWLATPFSTSKLVADMPLPGTGSLADLVAVVERGRTDLRSYLDAVLPADAPHRRWLASAGRVPAPRPGSDGNSESLALEREASPGQRSEPPPVRKTEPTPGQPAELASGYGVEPPSALGTEPPPGPGTGWSPPAPRTAPEGASEREQSEH